MRIRSFLVSLLLMAAGSASAQNLKLKADNIDEVVKALTLEEKGIHKPIMQQVSL